MSERNYWQRMRRRQMSRRALLGASARAGVGAAGLALVGCGDDDDDGQQAVAQAQQQAQQQQQAAQQEQAQQQAEQAAQQEDDQQQQQAAAAQAQQAPAVPGPGQGGDSIASYYGLNSGDLPTMDPYENLTYRTQTASGYHYTKLIREINGAPGVPPTFHGEQTPDASELPEVIDPVTYVFNIREDVYWHDVEPLNGRQLTVDDIMYTYDRFREVSPNGASWDKVVSSFEPGADNAITAKLHRPHAPFVILASSSQHLYLIPPEIVDDGTVAERPVGAGPFVFEEYEPGVALRWRHNPNWHNNYDGNGAPYYNTITRTLNADPNVIIQAVADGSFDYSRLSASVYAQMDGALPEEYDRDRAFVLTPTVVPGGFYFNFSIPPWNDVRMRLALSMALDRDGVLQGTDDTGQGVWQSGLPPMAPYWLDPKSDDFGPNSQYFQLNLAESQKLLDAAGYPNGIQATVHNTADYGATANNFFAANVASVAEGGFQFEIFSKEYAAYIASIFRGNFPDSWDGEESHLAIGPFYGGATDPEDIFAAVYSRTSGRHNWGSSGRTPDNRDDVLAVDTGGNAEAWSPVDSDTFGHPNSAIGGGPELDEELHSLMDEQRAILDFEERVQKIHDIQRYLAEKMYYVPYTAAPETYVYNPWVRHNDFDNVHPKFSYGTGNAFEPFLWTDQALKDELT